MKKLALLGLAALGFMSLVGCAADSADEVASDDAAITASSQKKKPAPVAETTVEGSLMQAVGIGGESTGASVITATGFYELILDDAERAQFVDGQKARITGTPKTLSGVETHNRKAIDVTDMLVCPADDTWVNCMPMIIDDSDPATEAASTARAKAQAKLCSSANRTWIKANCTGVNFAD